VLNIDPSANVSDKADIEDSVRGTSISIGPRVMIDAFVKIKPVGGIGDVTIGADSYLNSGTVIYSGNGVTIGSGVLIAANCTIAASNHAYRSSETPLRLQGFLPSKGGVTIEDDVWIGANSVLLDGSIVRKGAVVGAMSLVRGELQANGVYAGVPAELIGWRE
jgi:virginiamycin A acetyltransferase